MKRPRLRRPAHLAFVESAGVVFVAPMPGGPMQALPGSAGVIWQEALTGDRDGLSGRVAARTAMPAADIDAFVEGFVADLIARGVLEEDPADGLSDPS